MLIGGAFLSGLFVFCTPCFFSVVGILIEIAAGLPACCPSCCTVFDRGDLCAYHRIKGVLGFIGDWIFDLFGLAALVILGLCQF